MDEYFQQLGYTQFQHVYLEYPLSLIVICNRYPLSLFVIVIPYRYL